MQNNNRKKNSEAAQENNPAIQAATVEVIAGLFATLAEGLATFAAVLAVQEVQQLAEENEKSSADILEIQRQLNFLTKEVKKISKALNI
ncbi:multidrug ABC transporter ATPase [Solibacillus sp. R5-41]|uniref:multidrug ABC transporter ATPase n=1 Tax=Solibacillus sp. R5-41 TaxID=2048654 RepID=UPI000C1298FB|nr:multidrug ABC transporter ATPase [Solibacillus sp. R5-41]ATP40747.1 multidrug ABC transporter ATPase [Solibacillus sp. R5-41]